MDMVADIMFKERRVGALKREVAALPRRKESVHWSIVRAMASKRKLLIFCFLPLLLCCCCCRRKRDSGICNSVMAEHAMSCPLYHRLTQLLLS